MKWIEIRIIINPETEEIISNRLFELGSVGTFISDKILHAYFKKESWDPETANELNKYLHELSKMGFTNVSHSLSIEEIADKDWNEAWKKSLHPIHVTTGLIIKPSWVNLESSSEEIVIELDPQMAFGSGAHATTQLMLKLMCKNVQNTGSILDVGTGSGILIIAAAKLYGANITAIDIDPVAVATARANCERNSVLPRVELIAGDLNSLRNITFDMILANINRTAILALLRQLRLLLKPDGLMILSGIMISEKEITIRKLLDHQLTILQEVRQDEWVGLVVHSEK